MKLLLHACCGPCLLVPYDVFSREYEVEVFFFNPNIYPVEEYSRRRDALFEYANARDIAVHEEAYDPQIWLASAGAAAREGRCDECYQLRMMATARFAQARGFDAIASTLTVSPCQQQDLIWLAGRRAGEQSGLIYMDADLRQSFSDATGRSRELRMYRQNYCGCLPSMKEVEEAHAHKRDARRPRK